MAVVVTGSPSATIEALQALLSGRPAVLPEPSDAALAAAGVEGPIDDDVALLVPTSGSTRAPKIVELTLPALVASARATETVLGGPGRWLLCLPSGYIAGIQVVVRSLLAGTAPVVLPDGPFRPDVFTATVAAMEPGRRYVSLVPTQLTRLLDDIAATDALRSFAGVLVGGAATPIPLLARARAAGIAIRTTYGMSETSGGCVYDGQPLPGVTVDLDADGRIALGGPTLARRYRGDPAATAEAFVEGRFLTSDLGRWDDGRLTVLGRIDDVVNTGGRKVLPAEVSAAILAMPDVADVYVSGVPDPEWGEAVVAWVVPAHTVDTSTLADSVREVVRNDVGPVAVPRRIRFVDAIPQLATGKPDRRRLLATLADPAG